MKHTDNFPSISVVTATCNSTRTIERCLKSIRSQTYPQKKIEIIIADGGSKDETVMLAKKYGAKVYRIDPKKQNAEYNKSVGISHANNEIIAMIDHDNVLPHPRWFADMVRPLRENPNIAGVETLRYTYEPEGTLLDRYFALFGSGDPLVWYLGKTDRLSYMYDRYTLAGEVIQRHPYYVVRFTEQNMPTIGANGYLVRRDILMRNAYITPGTYFDMDVNIDLIRNGHTLFAFVDDGIIHNTGYGSVWYYLQRRMLFMKQYHLSKRKGKIIPLRRFHMVSKNNLWKLIIAILLCVTVVIPFVDSFRGWLRVRDRAWFLHPLMGLGFVSIYAWVIIKHQVQIYANYILGK